MFGDPSLWLMLGSMASTAGLIGFWFDREGGDRGGDAWSQLEEQD